MRGQKLLLLPFSPLPVSLSLLPPQAVHHHPLQQTSLPSHLRRRSLRLLIGILTRADLYDRRQFLRLIYGAQSSPSDEIHVKCVFCRLTKEKQRLLVALEILRFDGVIILNCTENMNNGKTYTFSSLPAILPRRYDYVMKADDDVFIRLEPLASTLKPLARSDLYYGSVIPCKSYDPFVEYMSGMGFVLSRDLVEWIATSEITANDKVGPVGREVADTGEEGEKPGNREAPDVRLPADERPVLARAHTGDGGGAPAQEMGYVVACPAVL